jgi:hypothetical protein
MNEFFIFLNDNNLTPNGFYVLHNMVNKITSYNVNTYHEQHKLSLNGYLNENYDSVDDTLSYTLTKKALDVIKNSEVYFTSFTKKVKSLVKFEDWQDNIKMYNELFPKGRKSGSTMSFRSTPKELFEKFKWFFNEYPEYDWDLVFKVTSEYIDEFDEKGDYTYMQTSKYFIKKDDKNKVTTSTLANLCYNDLEGNNDDVSMKGTFYFGP